MTWRTTKAQIAMPLMRWKSHAVHPFAAAVAEQHPTSESSRAGAERAETGPRGRRPPRPAVAGRPIVTRFPSRRGGAGSVRPPATAVARYPDAPRPIASRSPRRAREAAGVPRQDAARGGRPAGARRTVVARSPAEARAQAEAHLGGGRRAGRHQGPGARRRPRQGRRRQARRAARLRPRRWPGRSWAWTSRASRSGRVLVAPAADIVREFYLGAVLDRAARRILLMGSAAGRRRDRGGRRAPTRTPSCASTPTRTWACSTTRPARWPSRSAWAPTSSQPCAIARGLVSIMRDNDADLVEVNPAGHRARACGRRHRAADAAVPRRQGHHRRLRPPPPPGAGGHARPGRGGPDRRRGARPRASASSGSRAPSAAWSTAPGWP